MARVIWFALLVLAAVALWRGWRRRGASLDAAQRSPAKSVDAGMMVRCAHCGVHLDAQEAILARGQHYCCAAHLEARDTPSSRS
jgi:uncharacterized protein